ncbi:MAG: (2Fe-2S)-binding protein [Deltaproteobacteria bacterium]|nr:(2Fe-2S)-binding protein [Deltaproteobacteria bacterium]
MEHNIELKINGKTHFLTMDPNKTLLEAVREEIGLTGTKRNCEKGVCGTCTVIMDGKSVNSCLVLAIEAQGKDILTIEGLETEGELHPIQKAFIEEGAIQCGYCTPGMVMSAKALLDRNPKPSELDVRKGIEGNLCRCTGYVKIVDAILVASDAM